MPSSPCKDKCLDIYLAEVKEHWKLFLAGDITAAVRDALLAQSLFAFEACMENCDNPGQ